MEEPELRPLRGLLATLKTKVYILAHIVETSINATVLVFYIVPAALRDQINGKMVAFNPTKDIPSLAGKVILVTGGNAGLGKQTIQYLSSHSPSRIYLAARTQSKATSAISDIRTAVPNAPIEFLSLDLTSLASIAAAADAFKAKEKRLDILVNNAGVMAMPYSLTKEGYEIQFGTNHIGHALLTKLLLPTLLETAAQPGSDVRIVNLTSMAHFLAPKEGITWDQAALEKTGTWARYGQSKLANILFTNQLAARYPQITSVSIHPGVIITDLYTSFTASHFLKWAVWFYSLLTPILPGHFKDTKGGSLNQTWAAVVGKQVLENGALYTPVGTVNGGSGKARDEGLAKKLWEWTEGELGKHGY